MHLPSFEIQYAREAKDMWRGKVFISVKTAYASTVDAPGVMLQELVDTIKAGVYSNKILGKSDRSVV